MRAAPDMRAAQSENFKNSKEASCVSRGAKRQRARSTVKGFGNFLALEP